MLRMLLAMTVGALAVTSFKEENDKIGFSPAEAPKKETLTCPVIATLENFEAAQDSLDQMWDKIQELKETDTLAAQVMYEKYRKLSGELPPPTPSHIVEDQAVS